ncbi:response regulator [Sorangium sp. So ce381]|uniref:response regulator n=1 Tax=Sorangium sp. So ce381 TaxID=3133307 RepID=UPI003F5CB49E
MTDKKQWRVLVVDDEPVFTARLTIALRRLGFLTEAAIDCEAANRRILEDPPDVVCVSLSLPRDSGYHLCELIRRSPALHHLKIIVMSDRHSPEVIAYAEEAGANAFLKRPFKHELLAECMVTVLEEPRAPQVEASQHIPGTAFALG